MKKANINKMLALGLSAALLSGCDGIFNPQEDVICLYGPPPAMEEDTIDETEKNSVEENTVNQDIVDENITDEEIVDEETVDEEIVDEKDILEKETEDFNPAEDIVCLYGPAPEFQEEYNER